ncbi:hypothetical protein BDW22DRAFT_92230 [Trametopsis cervina]|nr:hypothetical protein BDW22DRAFT_92230 [Trametopsis cervina]
MAVNLNQRFAAELHRRMAALLEDNAVWSEKVVSLQQERDFAQDDVLKLRKQLSEVEAQRKQELDALQSALEEQRRNEASLPERLALIEEQTQLAASLQAAEERVKDSARQIEQLKRVNARLSVSLVASESQVRNKNQQLASTQAELDAAKGRELELAAKCASVQRVLATVRADFAKLQAASANPKPTADTQVQTEAVQTTNALTVVLRPPVPPTTPGPPYSHIPEARRLVLETFPVIALPSSVSNELTFRRMELSALLGGGLQGVDARFAVPKPIAAAHELTGCIFPQRQTNPWLPKLPGQHGYMFLGLEGPAKDNTKFMKPTERALFIQEDTGGWRYYGLYSIQRVPENDLTVEEWRAFDDSFKSGKYGYCGTTLAKRLGTSAWRSLVDNRAKFREELAAVQAEYDAGTRRVPCIVLQCIAYNEGLLRAIDSARTPEQATGKRKRRPSARRIEAESSAEPPTSRVRLE